MSGKNLSWAQRMDSLYMEIIVRQKAWRLKTPLWERIKTHYLGKPSKEVLTINSLIEHYNFCRLSGYINPAPAADIIENQHSLVKIEEKR